MQSATAWRATARARRATAEDSNASGASLLLRLRVLGWEEKPRSRRPADGGWTARERKDQRFSVYSNYKSKGSRRLA